MSTNGALMRPLAAVTPPRHMAHLVASRSYLSYQRAELQDKLKHNPYSYIQVINPDHSREVEEPRGTRIFPTGACGVRRLQIPWLVERGPGRGVVRVPPIDGGARLDRVVCNLTSRPVPTAG